VGSPGRRMSCFSTTRRTVAGDANTVSVYEPRWASLRCDRSMGAQVSMSSRIAVSCQANRPTAVSIRSSSWISA
jgi:hypothetical protein